MTKLVQTMASFDLEPLKKLVREQIIPGAADRDQKHEVPIQIFQELHRKGWMQAFIPESLGGPGFRLPDLIHIAKELAYGSSGVFSSYIVNMLGMSPLILYGNEALKNKLCTDFLSTFSLWSYCMTEPNTGSDIFHSQTRATRVKDGYILNGQKCFITNANLSEHLCIFAALENCPESKNSLTAFYVPGNSPGLSRGKPPRKMGQRDSNTGELFLDHVFVPDHHRIGNEGDGIKIAFHSLQRSKITIAAASIGVCERALFLVEDHLSKRILYNKPLLKIPQIQNQLSDLHTRVEAAWLLTCHAASTWTESFPAIKEASMAKMLASDLAVEVVSEALELFGGYGYSTEFEIERLHRDVRVFEIYEGPTLVQLALISKELYPEMYLKQSTPRKAA